MVTSRMRSGAGASARRSPQPAPAASASATSADRWARELRRRGPTPRRAPPGKGAANAVCRVDGPGVPRILRDPPADRRSLRAMSRSTASLSVPLELRTAVLGDAAAVLDVPRRGRHVARLGAARSSAAAGTSKRAWPRCARSRTSGSLPHRSTSSARSWRSGPTIPRRATGSASRWCRPARRAAPSGRSRRRPSRPTTPWPPACCSPPPTSRTGISRRSSRRPTARSRSTRIAWSRCGCAPRATWARASSTRRWPTPSGCSRIRPTTTP